MQTHSTTERVTHTPGPWRLKVSPHDDAMTEIFANPVAYPGDGPWRVAYVLRESNKRQRPIDDANARLVAAAPELLEALKALHGNVDRDLSGYWTESTSNFMQQAEAAIAKAEGGA